MKAGMADDGLEANAEAPCERLEVRPWIVPNDEEAVPSWECLPPAPALARWASEVRSALELGQDADWRLIGPAILVLHEEHDAVVQLCARIAVDLKFQFVRIPAERLEEPLAGLRDGLEAVAPALVLLDRGRWSEPTETDDGLPNAANIHTSLVSELRNFNPASPVVFVASSKSLEFAGSILRKPGGLDRIIAVAPASKEALGRSFIEFLGPGVASASLRAKPAKLGMILRNEFKDAEARSLAALHLRRIASRQARPVEFNDVVDLALRGAIEGDDGSTAASSEDLRRRVAAHEAGHAAVALLGSGGRNIPEYASIIPAREFRGIVMDSITYHDAREEMTYADVQLKARVFLAGRAAEEIVLGPQNVGSGADSDLENATGLCVRYFGYSGFAPRMERPGVSGSNLAVVCGEMNVRELERTSDMVRTFLTEEYAEVISMLREHRGFFDAIAERLMWDPVVDADEMRELAAAHGIPLAVAE